MSSTKSISRPARTTQGRSTTRPTTERIRTSASCGRSQSRLFVDRLRQLGKREGEDFFASYLPRVAANPDAVKVKFERVVEVVKQVVERVEAHP